MQEFGMQNAEFRGQKAEVGGLRMEN